MPYIELSNKLANKVSYKVKSGRRSAILNLIKLKKIMVYPHLKSHILFDGNGLAIWHGFPVLTYIEVRSGCTSAILNLIKLKFFMAYPCTFQLRETSYSAKGGGQTDGQTRLMTTICWLRPKNRVKGRIFN